MVFKKLIRCGVIILLLAFASGCPNDNNCHSTVYAENSCPEFCAKAKSAWDRPFYFRLLSNGELFVYRSQCDYSLDEFLSEAKEVELIYQKQLSPEELKEMNNAFDTIGVWKEETLIAYDLWVVQSYYLNSYQYFYLVSNKNPGYSKVMELLIQYSIGTVYIE